MKRIAEWFAAVGAAAGRSGKRLVAVVAAVAMLGGVAGVSATAMADDGNASTTQSETTAENAARQRACSSFHRGNKRRAG